MENRLRMGLLACGVGVLMLAGGCARQAAPPASQGASAGVDSTEATAVVYPQAIGSKEGSAPALTFKEYQVPAMGELEGYGERFAAIKYNMRAAGEPTTISLLDFTTGTTKQAVSRAVNFKNGYNIVGVSGADRWVAWEELNGGEGVAASKDAPGWKLYAASIDADSMTCGTPVLVAEAALTSLSRPLFRVEGDTLYWLTNSAADGQTARSASGASVKARDLAKGDERTVCETKRHYATMSVENGSVIVTEEGDESKEAIVRVFDAASGAETWSLGLKNTDYISHFPQVHDGALVWTVFGEGGLSYPDLFYRGTDGVTIRVRNTASDPIPVGKYVFYDAVTVSGSGVSQKIEGFTIGGYDPATNETFTVIGGEDARDDIWDMPMARGYSPDTFVVSTDSRPSTATVAEYAKFPMRIRRYTVPAR